ncbi:putative membrane protein (plasmid) [Clostridium sporogenes]|nr:putative membrane protein [Clostridium botulinum Prevot_594]
MRKVSVLNIIFTSMITYFVCYTKKNFLINHDLISTLVYNILNFILVRWMLRFSLILILIIGIIFFIDILKDISNKTKLKNEAKLFSFISIILSIASLLVI